MNWEKTEKSILTLKQNHDDTISEIESSKSIKSIFESAIHELDYFRDYIFNFFSYEGARDEIKNMYESISNRENNWKTIKTCDLDNCRLLFNNYNDGMKSYIKDLFTTESPDNCDEICKKISAIKDTDKIFIESIFGGKNNESEDQSITEGVKNIECLIDLLNNLEVFKESLNNIHKSIRDENAVVLECAKLYSESVNNYCANTISWIISDYLSIQNLIHQRPRLASNDFKIV